MDSIAEAAKPAGKTSVAEVCRVVDSMVKDCETYRDDQSVDRVKAMEYFDGEMKDVPSEDGRSKVVSRDVRGEIKKVLPSIVRIILGNDKVVEYLPNAEGDEETAQQATDYVNYLVFPESGGRNAVRDAIDDSLRLRNGILKWWQDERIEVKYSNHSGLDEMAFAQLVSDDAVEVLEHTAREEEIDTPQGPMPAPVHDVRIRRRIVKARQKLAAVPLENWLIHPDATCIEEAPICGENYRIRRSDLVAMGHDREKVDKLPMATGRSREADVEEQTRRRDALYREDLAAFALQEVEYYDLLVRIDQDNDGIAELRRMIFAGGVAEQYLLSNEEWDEVNYCDVVCERRPHQWEGTSVFDDVGEIQKIKTVLERQTLDNLYWQNNPQPLVQEGKIVNPGSVTNPAFGEPIRIQSGTDVRTAIGYNTVPFVADKSFQMLAYLDQEKHDRTGISDASSGLAPDALQNMTAKASAMIEQAGIGQTEMMVWTIANCLKPMFRGLLRLAVQHQDKPRTVRLRNKWVEYDPRTWNADMDCTVNTGLGAGTRERDMMMMQIVTTLQEKIVQAFGAENPMVTPEQIYNGIAKTVEAAGLKGIEQFFTRPEPDEIEAYRAKKQSQPSPEQIKINGQKELEQMRGQVQMQLKDKDIQKEASKEREQRDADLVIKNAELEKETVRSMHEAELRAQSDAASRELEREKIASNERIAMAKLLQDADLKREEMDRADARADRERESAILRTQAASIGKAFERNEQREMAQ